MLIAPMLLAACTVGQSPEKDLARLVQEGVLRTISSRRAWSFRVSDVRMTEKAQPPTHTNIGTFAGEGDRFVWRYLGDAAAPAGSGLVEAHNGRYWFRLSRENDGDWHIDQLAMGVSPDRDLFSERSILAPSILPDYFIYIQRWDSLVADPTFQLTSSVERGGARELAFRLNGPLVRGTRVVSGKVRIDPKLGSLLSYEADVEFRSDPRGHVTGETQYDGEIAGMPRLAKHEWKMFDPGVKSPLVVKTLSYSDVTPGRLRESEAMLSHFGIPEPASLERQGIPAWAAIALAGACCLVLALWLKHRQGRN